jgi:hypothetical protein
LYNVNGLEDTINYLKSFKYYKWADEDLGLQWKIFQRPFIDVKETCTPYLDNFINNFGWDKKLDYSHQIVLIIAGVLSGVYIIAGLGVLAVMLDNNDKAVGICLGMSMHVLKLIMFSLFMWCYVLAKWRVDAIAPLLEN